MRYINRLFTYLLTYYFLSLSFVLEYLSQILTLCINMKLNIIGTR